MESVRVSVKQTNDFVTEVDQAAEAAIIDTLLTAYPDHAIWAEESGKREGGTAAQTTSGSSTRWTAPPTSFTASRFTA